MRCAPRLIRHSAQLIVPPVIKWRWLNAARALSGGGFCGHDEGYTPTVHFTGQKAMVHAVANRPRPWRRGGYRRGVVSGTVGGISEPISHAAQIRAEGRPVIRRLDRFHMNNRNTLGEAIFVRDTRSYPAPTDDNPLPDLIRLADGSSSASTARSGSGSAIPTLPDGAGAVAAIDAMARHARRMAARLPSSGMRSPRLGMGRPHHAEPVAHRCAARMKS